jgi:hypothetical protein
MIDRIATCLSRPCYKLRLVVDVAVLQLLLLAVTSCLDRPRREALAYLVEDNPVPLGQFVGRRLQLIEDGRPRACRTRKSAWPSGPTQLATIVTADTFSRSHWPGPRARRARRCVRFPCPIDLEDSAADWDKTASVLSSIIGNCCSSVRGPISNSPEFECDRGPIRLAPSGARSAGDPTP